MKKPTNPVNVDHPPTSPLKARTGSLEDSVFAAKEQRGLEVVSSYTAARARLLRQAEDVAIPTETSDNSRILTDTALLRNYISSSVQSLDQKGLLAVFEALAKVAGKDPAALADELDTNRGAVAPTNLVLVGAGDPVDATLPSAAPESWKDRRRDVSQRSSEYENPIRFLKRVYAGCLLNDDILNSLDGDLFSAARHWVRRHPADSIPGLRFRLPSLEERIASLTPTTPIDEIKRVGAALGKRKLKPNQTP